MLIVHTYYLCILKKIHVFENILKYSESQAIIKRIKFVLSRILKIFVLLKH